VTRTLLTLQLTGPVTVDTPLGARRCPGGDVLEVESSREWRWLVVKGGAVLLAEREEELEPAVVPEKGHKPGCKCPVCARRRDLAAQRQAAHG
jgi:hypothetical protein